MPKLPKTPQTPPNEADTDHVEVIRTPRPLLQQEHLQPVLHLLEPHQPEPEGGGGQVGEDKKSSVLSVRSQFSIASGPATLTLEMLMSLRDIRYPAWDVGEIMDGANRIPFGMLQH